ncbi:MAG: hypothetical protein KatS3mg055_0743 [Chloroflexus sp.]|nr:MAG: hypothetical protein KatS3mg055_0743 [Chloroflexus sp.]
MFSHTEALHRLYRPIPNPSEQQCTVALRIPGCVTETLARKLTRLSGGIEAPQCEPAYRRFGRGDSHGGLPRTVVYESHETRLLRQSDGCIPREQSSHLVPQAAAQGAGRSRARSLGGADPQAGHRRGV